MKDGVGVHGAPWARATKNVKKFLGKKGIEKKNIWTFFICSSFFIGHQLESKMYHSSPRQLAEEKKVPAIIIKQQFVVSIRPT